MHIKNIIYSVVIISLVFGYNNIINSTKRTYHQISESETDNNSEQNQQNKKPRTGLCSINNQEFDQAILEQYSKHFSDRNPENLNHFLKKLPQDLAKIIINIPMFSSSNAAFLPLHYALKNNNRRLIEILLNYGANVDAIDQEENNALCVAVTYTHQQVLADFLSMITINNFSDSFSSLLKDEYSDIENKKATLFTQKNKHNKDALNILLEKIEKNLSVELPDDDIYKLISASYTIYKMLAEENYTSINNYIINTASSKLTPLAIAIILDDIGLASILLKKGANPNELITLKKIEGNHAFLSIYYNNLDMLDLLHNHNVEINYAWTDLNEIDRMGTIADDPFLNDFGYGIDNDDLEESHIEWTKGILTKYHQKLSQCELIIDTIIRLINNADINIDFVAELIKLYPETIKNHFSKFFATLTKNYTDLTLFDLLNTHCINPELFSQILDPQLDQENDLYISFNTFDYIFAHLIKNKKDFDKLFSRLFYRNLSLTRPSDSTIIIILKYGLKYYNFGELSELIKSHATAPDRASSYDNTELYEKLTAWSNEEINILYTRLTYCYYHHGEENFSKLIKSLKTDVNYKAHFLNLIRLYIRHNQHNIAHSLYNISKEFNAIELLNEGIKTKNLGLIRFILYYIPKETRLSYINNKNANQIQNIYHQIKLRDEEIVDNNNPTPREEAEEKYLTMVRNKLHNHHLNYHELIKKLPPRIANYTLSFIN